jgi:plastocyanin
MVSLPTLTFVLACVLLPRGQAAELPSSFTGSVEGTIVIKRKLTKRKVTAPAALYARGPAVELGAEPATDPLAYERSHVVVYLEGNLPSKPVTATMDQKGRRFVPELLVVPEGSTVSFPNLDAIFHNVFSLSKPKAFDLGNYPKEQTRLVTFPKPGVVYVYCHLHPNMAAAVVVTPNRWCATASPEGKFSLAGVPAGKYTAVAWHKAAGYFRTPVEVVERRASEVQFIIPLDEAQIGRAMGNR